MSRVVLNRLLTSACAAAAMMLGSSASATVAVTDDPVLYWNQVLSTGLAGSPTVTSRGYAMVGVAIHDAVNATMGKPDISYLKNIATAGGDTRAATSVAAHDLLVALNPAKQAQFDAQLAASLALVPNGVDKTNGIATGAKIAQATLAARASDGSTAVVSYTPSGLPGGWAPTPPGFVPAAVPQWASVDPWLMQSQNQFRPAPPPSLTSEAYTAAFNEVLALGAANSAVRTVDQSAAALFWAAASGNGPWIQAGIDGAQAKGLSTLENARLFGLLNVAIADAAIAIWDAKFTYDYWRPVTGIRLADLDGNAATLADPNWTPFIVTPPHPSYVSGHSAVSGAASTVLSAFLGNGNSFCLTSGALNRCWSGYEAAALDAANSRLWGGIHWSFDNTAGLDLGHSIGNFALTSGAFRAVPEPVSWALMITGFGFAGLMLRRRPRAHIQLSKV
jgi:membrane-associated phospholipid phosphatase